MTIYLYVLDTLADWEIGHAMAELNSRRFFKKGAPEYDVKTVSLTKGPIRTMGGLTVLPDLTFEDILIRKDSVLLLPGSDTWSDTKHGAILQIASRMLDVGATVGALCGATVALANARLLDQRPHTSNGVGFLDMAAPAYKGKAHYVDEPSVADGNLITAACTGGLLWAKQLLQRLDVFSPDTLEAWYNYFSTGKAEHFFALMQAAQASREG